ncbi:MAG TPA: MBL fold metallo-hydrolase [Thermomicrobiales bacterium]|nr:MBL fold metallo-hydrolase [Thermomicrobiales bacterium]
MTAPDGLQVVQVPAGPIATNAWVVVDRKSGEALIVDAPPDALGPIGEVISEADARPVMLVLTHTHWDHIGDAEAIRAQYDIPLAVHPLERGRLDAPGDTPAPVPPARVDRELAEGDELELGDQTLVVMHTPGHSPGQVSLYLAAANLLFGGDTLFPNGYGRTDIPGASEEDTVATISRLLELPDEVTVLSGHGEPTTIGRERRWMQHVADTGRLLG